MSRRPAFRLALGTLALAAMLAPGLADAQINPFRGPGADQLTRQDLSVVGAAVHRLLAHDPLPDGTVENWKNEKTGASGTVTAGHSLTRHGLECRQVLYVGKSRRGLHPHSGTLDWCKTADGTWKIGS